MVATAPVMRYQSWVPAELDARLRSYNPKTELGKIIKSCFRSLPREQAMDLLDKVLSVAVIETSLSLVHIHGKYRGTFGRRDDYGVVSRKVVTDTGVGLIVDALDNSLADATIKYHGLGTGGTAEGASQTALVTEITTEYIVNSTRATGTFSQPSANISQSLATNTVDASVACTEHGVFAQAAVPGGVMLDRSLFSVINLISGDSLASTYQLSIASGG